MTNGDKILADIAAKKVEAMTLASKYIALSKNGEQLGCEENNLVILVGQINSLTRFYNNNFDANGAITPIYVCPSLTLIRKYINPNYTPPVGSGFIINSIDGNP